jgi:hypothetical protein
MSKLVEATDVTLGGEIGSPDAWARPYLDDEHTRYANKPLTAADALLRAGSRMRACPSSTPGWRRKPHPGYRPSSSTG